MMVTCALSCRVPTFASLVARSIVGREVAIVDYDQGGMPDVACKRGEQRGLVVKKLEAVYIEQDGEC
jgi:hypothetical protein